MSLQLAFFTNARASGQNLYSLITQMTKVKYLTGLNMTREIRIALDTSPLDVVFSCILFSLTPILR